MDYRILAKIILLSVILGCIGYLSITAENYKCNQCSVTFSNYKIAGSIGNFSSVKYFMTELFEESKLKECPIYWDRVQGYVRQ